MGRGDRRCGTLAALLGICALALGAGPARTQETTAPSGIVSFTFENDTFVQTDRYYTAGNRIAWQSTQGAPEPLAAVGKALPVFLLPDAPIQWGVAVSQSIFTSRHTQLRDPARDDRPYAGQLLGTLSLWSMDSKTLGVAELSLGVIGPDAGADQVQNTVHDLLNRGEVEGWRHQISNRPAGMLTFERRWQLNAPLGVSGLEVGIVPAVGVNLGNVQTSGAVGLLARVGQDLSIDFGPPRIRPALSGLGVYRAPQGFAWYAFLGVEGRAVGYEATLDGNRHGYWKVDREPLVGELPFGLELAYRRVRLALSGVLQSKTFESQSGTFAYGSITASIEY